MYIYILQNTEFGISQFHLAQAAEYIANALV